MLNGRLYRAAFLPLVFALAIAAFSLSARPRPLASTLAPDAFDGSRAFADLTSLASAFGSRRPGSLGDARLAARISGMLEGLGGTAGGGFTVRTRSFAAQTIDGERTLSTVVAQRPGSTGEAPIVILAHRDGVGNDRAELSGTAALIELARVFAARETRRTIVLVSTSAGSGGDAGAADFAAHGSQIPGATGAGAGTAAAGGGTAAEGGGHGLDAAIVLGDLAGVRARKPSVVPFSDGSGSAPLELQRTVADAITRETGSDPGAPSMLGQLAHLAFHFTVGEQGPLDAGGIPAVLVQVSGERGPSVGDAVSRDRLESFGRAVLSAVDALDTAPDVPAAMQTGVLVQRKTIPAWAVRLLLAALLLPPLVVAADGLARVRRRRSPVSPSVARCTLWMLACALPFFAGAVFARLLGVLGIIGAAPSEPVGPNALPFDGAAARAVVAVGLVLALAWLAWPMLVRRLGVGVLRHGEAVGMAMLLLLLAVCLLVWAINPFAALLLVPATHLWLLIVSEELRPRPPVALALVALALLPLALLVSFYARELGLGPAQVVHTAVLLLAGGHVGIPAAMLWSLALGCAAAATMLALTAPAPGGGPDAGDSTHITIRGPVSYAGPGSLGGTESALRR